MRQFFQSVWWWFRVAVIVIVGAYVLALFWKNTGQTISLWYWPNQPVETTSVVALALASFILGGIVCTMGWALLSATIRFRRSRAERKRRMVEEQREAISRKAAMLRVKPAPLPVVRQPKVEPARPIELAPEPAAIEIEIPPPPPAKSAFSTGAIPVEVDQVVILTPPPAESVDDDAEGKRPDVIDIVDDRPRESKPAEWKQAESKPQA